MRQCYGFEVAFCNFANDKVIQRAARAVKGGRGVCLRLVVVSNGNANGSSGPSVTATQKMNETLDDFAATAVARCLFRHGQEQQ